MVEAAASTLARVRSARVEAQAELEEYKARALEAESQLDYLNRHHKEYCM